jgi:hypothetical protein
LNLFDSIEILTDKFDKQESLLIKKMDENEIKLDEYETKLNEYETKLEKQERQI